MRESPRLLHAGTRGQPARRPPHHNGGETARTASPSAEEGPEAVRRETERAKGAWDAETDAPNENQSSPRRAGRRCGLGRKVSRPPASPCPAASPHGRQPCSRWACLAALSRGRASARGLGVTGWAGLPRLPAGAWLARVSMTQGSPRKPQTRPGGRTRFFSLPLSLLLRDPKSVSEAYSSEHPQPRCSPNPGREDPRRRLLLSAMSGDSRPQQQPRAVPAVLPHLTCLVQPPGREWLLPHPAMGKGGAVVQRNSPKASSRGQETRNLPYQAAVRDAGCPLCWLASCVCLPTAPSCSAKHQARCCSEGISSCDNRFSRLTE